MKRKNHAFDLFLMDYWWGGSWIMSMGITKKPVKQGLTGFF